MKRLACASLLATMPALAALSGMDDYASGMTIDVTTTRPVVELTLPDELYQKITRTDLADMRVFNRDGAAVLHAVCAADVVLAPLVVREQLSVFEVEAPPGNVGKRVEVHTAGGTQVQINEPSSRSEATAAKVSAHVIDARAATGQIRAIDLEWNSPDGASEAQVQIQASEDLDHWQTAVARSALLQVSGGTEQLRRQRIPLPLHRYAYLRMQRVDGGPPLRIDGAQAEVVAASTVIDPVWFSAERQSNAQPRSLVFASSRLAPISYARLSLPQANSSVRVEIQSRDDEQAPWRTHWSGEVYDILNNGERRISPPAEFPVTHDKYWRIHPIRSTDPFYDSSTFELGYRPAKLRFLAQGAGPFTLAYGSRRAEPAPAPSCDQLLGDVNSKDMTDLVGQGSATSTRSLGGETALKPLPAQTPTRLLVLWGVLIGGVGLLMAMAWSLFKRLKQSSM